MAAPILTDAYAAATHLARIYTHPTGDIPPHIIQRWAGLIRQWAHRGYLARYPPDSRGRTRYDLVDITRRAAQQAIAATPTDGNDTCNINQQTGAL
jgi:hypothetical protein